MTTSATPDPALASTTVSDVVARSPTASVPANCTQQAQGGGGKGEGANHRLVGL